MQGTGRKLTHLESRRCGHSYREAGSKLVASLKIKNGGKLSQNRKPKPKCTIQVRKMDSTLIKTKFPKSLSKCTGKDSMSPNPTGENILLKQLFTKSSKKLSKSKLQVRKTSLSSSECNANVADAEVKIKKLKKRRKKKRQKEYAELDEASRLQRRTRYLLIKMKLEQNLIDAYSGEGWKGQSREKIRPEKELQRARKQILKCKLGIRDAVRQLDSLSSVGSIEDSVISPDGSVHHEHIFCAKCKLREAFPDNDIILCDGTCNRAFHQKCLDPPLDTKNIPPEDQGWFCKFCECKMDILEAINAHLGTRFSMDSHWEDVFKEEAALPDGENGVYNQEEEWPSDDSEDDDYNPERMESSNGIGEEGNDDNVSDVSSSSTSLSWSLDSEVFCGKEGIDHENHSVASTAKSNDFIEGAIICGRRRRQAVDYKKLYNEMFGKEAPAYEQVSEDEDWGPARKRRRREKESDAASTLMTLYESEQKSLDMGAKAENKLLPGTQSKSSSLRIPRNAVEKLRQVFADNELPSRAVKKKISEELGLDPEKVSKWFKNARYLALKTRKAERANFPTSPRNSKESRCEVVNKNAADHLTSKDTLTETSTLKTAKDCKRKQLKSLRNPSNTKHHKRSTIPASANSNKEVSELGDDESLKKLLRERMKKKRKNVNDVAGGGFQLAEVEMERLCKVKSRLETMKERLLRFCDRKTKKSDRSLVFEQQSMIYVPVAELKERA